MNNSKFTIALMFGLLVGIGSFFAYFSSQLPRWVNLLGVEVFIFLSFFLGMVAVSFHATLQKLEFERAMEKLRVEFDRLVSVNSNSYEHTLEMCVRAITYKVGLRVIREMLNGLDNDEQREAALLQISQITMQEMTNFRDMCAQKDVQENGHADTSS